MDDRYIKALRLTAAYRVQSSLLMLRRVINVLIIESYRKKEEKYVTKRFFFLRNIMSFKQCCGCGSVSLYFRIRVAKNIQNHGKIPQ